MNTTSRTSENSLKIVRAIGKDFEKYHESKENPSEYSSFYTITYNLFIICRLKKILTRARLFACTAGQIKYLR